MIKFGPSGNCESFYAEGYSHTEQSAKFVKDRGLDCFEYSFGRGVRMTEEKARSIGAAFQKEGVEISAHAPYFINFANPDDEMAAKSYGYVLDTARVLQWMGGKRVVFHPAAQGKATREDAVALTETRLKILRDLVYARERGSLKTVADYQDRLQYMIDELGYERMKHFHMHFSKIMYSAKGEVKHLTFEDDVYGPEFEPLAVALKALALEPYIVSESSGTQSEDAKYMKNAYFSM